MTGTRTPCGAAADSDIVQTLQFSLLTTLTAGLGCPFPPLFPPFPVPSWFVSLTLIANYLSFLALSGYKGILLTFLAVPPCKPGSCP